MVCLIMHEGQMKAVSNKYHGLTPNQVKLMGLATGESTNFRPGPSWISIYLIVYGIHFDVPGKVETCMPIPCTFVALFNCNCIAHSSELKLSMMCVSLACSISHELTTNITT